MNRVRTLLTMAVVAGATNPLPALAQSAFDPARDTVAAILRTPATDGGGYARYTFPRSDLTVMVGDVQLAPTLALGSWAGFVGTPAAAEAMGDIIATDAELPVVLNAFVSARLDVTAIHDHLNDETPRLTYLHFHGSGNAVDLAQRVNIVVSATAAPRPGAHPSTAPAAPVTIDTAEVFRVLGAHGRVAGSVVAMSFMLVGGPVRIDGEPVFGPMAYGTPITIQQVTPSRAVATGDFAILAGKVQPVLRELTRAGITATALHTHMIGATPEVYYLHFWGDAPLPALLQGIRNALSMAQK